MRVGLIGLLIVAILVIIVGSSAYFTVHQNEQAIVLQLGDPKRVIRDPGLYFKIPIMQDVVIYDRRVLDFNNEVDEVVANDKKRLVVDTFARYRIEDPLKFFQAVGVEAAARDRLGNLLNAAMRRVIGSVKLSDVVSGERSKLMGQIRDFVNAEALQFGVNVIDVRIRRADLPQENSEAIYKSMQADRERIARQNRAEGEEQSLKIKAETDRMRAVILSEATRDSEIIRGQGDAEAVRIFAEAFGKDAEFFAFYRSMQAYREALGGSNTTMVLSPDSEFFKYFGGSAGSLLGVP
ncbi:MAG: protease modulator HflC [Alphaproteobacteria bacterium]|nr:protease modulator HflC [Alphaproteobacteria bacterium]